MPITVDNLSQCPVCYCVVTNPEAHIRWHMEQDKRIHAAGAAPGWEG